MSDVLPDGWECDNDDLYVTVNGICDHVWIEVRRDTLESDEPWYSETWFSEDDCASTSQGDGWGWSATRDEQFERIGDLKELKAEEFCPVCLEASE